MVKPILTLLPLVMSIVATASIFTPIAALAQEENVTMEEATSTLLSQDNETMEELTNTLVGNVTGSMTDNTTGSTNITYGNTTA
jgi:hypothetical protein